MTELENQNLPEQEQPEQSAPEQTQPEAAPAETAGTIQTEPVPFTGPDAASDPVPTLTLEPEPAADPFADLPEPPKAPEPPKETPPQQPQYTQPQYTQTQYTQPQYTAPQQTGAPQYQQPYYQGQPQPQQPFQQPAKVYYNVPPAGYPQKSRLAAGLLAILFGCFGVHNFYLGFRSRATIQLVVSVVGMLLAIAIIGIFAVLGMEIWAFIEGVQILSANNPERLYDANGVILRD